MVVTRSVEGHLTVSYTTLLSGGRRFLVSLTKLGDFNELSCARLTNVKCALLYDAKFVEKNEIIGGCRPTIQHILYPFKTIFILNFSLAKATQK